MAGVNGLGGKFEVKHGKSRHPGYRTWYGMVSRCTNPNHVYFSYYGGRGISVCDEWLNGPDAFLEWLEKSGWEPGMQIDRKDNDDGYSPRNCRVTTPLGNGANKRNNRMIDVHGTMMTVAQAARFLGLPVGTLSARLSKGFSGNRLIAPARHKRPTSSREKGEAQA